MTAILLVGCGRMGGAMLRGWLARGTSPASIIVVEPAFGDSKADVGVVNSIDQVPPAFQPDIVVLAVKPQVMEAVLPLLARFADAVFLSIAAGRTLAFLDRHLGGGRAIIRAMPNTPAAIGRGITVAVANSRVTAAQRDACHHLLEAVGQAAWVESEGLIDAVTAVSGSGPAYVFLLAEAMTKAGIEAGLPDELAAALARATVSGSGELLAQSSDSPGALREAVTSPNGTTFAALQVLMAQDGLEALMTRAVIAAANRSRELAG